MVVHKGTDRQMDTRGGNVRTVSWLPYNSTPQGFMANYLQEEL